MLPAFQHAQNSELTALVSGDQAKREAIGKQYALSRTYTYEQFGECLASGNVVMRCTFALPNHLHRQYAEAAARAGVHILCEKPLAQNESECRKIIEAARAGGVYLMTAYRLHFEEANLAAVAACESGKLGDVRIFQSVFCQQVEEGDITGLANDIEQGGGPLGDIGVYLSIGTWPRLAMAAGCAQRTL